MLQGWWLDKLVLINRGWGEVHSHGSTLPDSLMGEMLVFSPFFLPHKPEVLSDSSPRWLLLPVRQEITSLAKITSCGKTLWPHREEHVFPRRLCF